jgi:hypothetical protein
LLAQESGAPLYTATGLHFWSEKFRVGCAASAISAATSAASSSRCNRESTQVMYAYGELFRLEQFYVPSGRAVV